MLTTFIIRENGPNSFGQQPKKDLRNSSLDSRIPPLGRSRYNTSFGIQTSKSQSTPCSASSINFFLCFLLYSLERERPQAEEFLDSSSGKRISRRRRQPAEGQLADVLLPTAHRKRKSILQQVSRSPLLGCLCTNFFF